MKYKVSELLNNYEDNSAVLNEMSDVSTENIAKACFEKINSSGKNVRSIRHLKRITVLTAAVLMLLALCITGYATGAFDAFINNSFGKGIEDKDTEVKELWGEYGQYIESKVYPSNERISPDMELAQKLIGEYLIEESEDHTVGDYTFKIENALMDENGCGVVTIDVSNPAGHGFDSNGISSDNADNFDVLPRLSMGTDMAINKFVLSNGYSAANIGFSIYFAPYYNLEADEDFKLLAYTSSDGNLIEKAEIPLQLKKIPALEMSTDGLKISISPIGMKAVLTDMKDADEENYLINELIIKLNDGTEYTVIRGNETGNVGVFTWTRDEARIGVCFNRLVDIENIAEIELTVTHIREDSEELEKYLVS